MHVGLREIREVIRYEMERGNDPIGEYFNELGKWILVGLVLCIGVAAAVIATFSLTS